MPFKETKNYYNKYANLIDKYFPQGYQYSLIFNEKYSNLPLSDQNNFFLTELAELNSSMSILDVGCGNGQFYEFIKKHYDCEYYGIDLAENQIKNCKEKYNQNIFECADMHSFKSNKKYDVCYLIESIGYSNNILSLVESIYSLLKPNGQVIIKFPYKNVINEEKNLKVEKLFEPVKKEYGFVNDSLGIVIEKEDIEKEFISCGFKLITYDIPNSDYFEYNYPFFNFDELKITHPEYIKISLTIMNKNLYYPNVYGECGIYKFQKIIHNNQNK
jgi:SAM-dependent methyltransferase